ncbi:MAG: protein kinase [Polyangiaceae bacterium]|nr:protein kinase [Polyangiaceae bacterium]
MFAIGERFDRYRIEALLGQGGMGAVYRAFDTKLERRVALKILRTSAEPSEHDSAGHAARLLREARAAAALDHPNVISIYDVGEVDGTTFLAMEFIEGRSLRTFVESDTPIATRLAWLVDIARALALAHRRGLVHRDIKPENVMLRDDGVIKVLDFGIARRAHAIADSTGTLTNQSTTLGTGNESKLVGTPHYMAPEQMRGGQIDGRTDQFAWGVLAYELLSRGALPWPNAHDLVALVAAVMSEDPVPMPNVAALDPTVVGVVMRALRRAPQERFASMEDVLAALGEEPAPSIRSGLAARNASLRNTPGASAAALADTLGAADAIAVGQAPAESSTDKRTSTTGALAETIAADKLDSDKPAVPTRGRRKRALIAVGVIVSLGLVGVGAYAVRTKTHGGLDGSSTKAATNIPGTRRAIAVLGFRSLSGREDVAWIGTALTETMTGELAMGEQLRTSSVDDVERMKRDLSLGDTDKLDKKALTRIGKHLGTELVVSGTYLAVGGKVRLDVRLVDVKTGEVLATVNESDTESALIDLVARAGSSVRRHLRAGDLSQEQEKNLRALQPATPEAARAYAEGLAKLRTFDGVGAQKAFERVVTLEPAFAPGHAALTDARLMLGLGDAAIESAKRAMELSQSLRREERMVNEVRYYEATSAWAKAIEVAQTLHGVSRQSRTWTPFGKGSDGGCQRKGRACDARASTPLAAAHRGRSTDRLSRGRGVFDTWRSGAFEHCRQARDGTKRIQWGRRPSRSEARWYSASTSSTRAKMSRALKTSKQRNGAQQRQAIDCFSSRSCTI